MKAAPLPFAFACGSLLPLVLAGGLVTTSTSTAAADSPTNLTTAGAAPSPSAAQPIDLPTALRLAGARNLDVEIARERTLEARAVHEQARLQYFPWLAPGFGYRRHEGSLQDVAGNVFDVTKQSYQAGATLAAQVNFGDAIYQSLAARQRAQAADAGESARRRDAVLLAAIGYFELSRAVGAVAATTEAIRITEDFAGQVRRAVDAGIGFRGDVFRTGVEVERNRSQQRQAEEHRRVAAARLAEILRLPPATDLYPAVTELAPITLVDTNAALDTIVSQAVANRPESRRSDLLAASAESERLGALRGPWIPTVGASAFLGGFGGGPDDHLGTLDDSQDYFLGLSWKIGPGGLLDRGRLRAAESRQRTSTLEQEKMRLEIQRQVVEARTRCLSLGDRLEFARAALSAAEQLLELSRNRKEFGVGAVLETIQAEQELTRTRLDYLRLVAEHNQAQYALRYALGE